MAQQRCLFIVRCIVRCILKLNCRGSNVFTSVPYSAFASGAIIWIILCKTEGADPQQEGLCIVALTLHTQVKVGDLGIILASTENAISSATVHRLLMVCNRPGAGMDRGEK